MTMPSQPQRPQPSDYLNAAPAGEAPGAYAPAPQMPSKKGSKLLPIIGASAACLLLGMGIGAALNNGTAGAQGATTTVTVTASGQAGATSTRVVTVTQSAAAAVTKTVTTTTTREAPAPANPVPAGPKVSFGDGTWLVNKDIAPGTYRTTVSSRCYWERRNNASGDFDGIVANENVSGGAQALVEILASDVAFKASGCGTWEKVE